MIEPPCQGISKSQTRLPQSYLWCPISTSFILQNCLENDQTGLRHLQSPLVADQSELKTPQITFPRDPSCLFRADNTCLSDTEKSIFNISYLSKQKKAPLTVSSTERIP